MSSTPHRAYDATARVLSLLCALAIIIILSPVLAIVAIAVRTTLGRPVFFTQERPGLEGHLFTVHKFRTMRLAEQPLSSLDAVATDAGRLTGLGRFLRATSLDELPQLFDVISGHMNLVGPRPLLPEYLTRYSPYHARRHEVRPGMTGWAQVNGRNQASWNDRFDMDVWYVDHRSLRLDLTILVRTIRVALSREGVSAEGSETALPYEGNGRRE